MAFDDPPGEGYWAQERIFKAKLRAALPWGWHEVNIEVDADDSGVLFLGTVKRLGPAAKPQGLDCLAPSFELDHELRELYLSSKARPNGPWYHCKVSLNCFNGRGFSYWWEGDEVETINDLHPRMDGRFPLFVFRRPLRASFLGTLPQARGAFAVAERVKHLQRERRPVAEALLQIAAINEWLISLGAGGMDQFFSKYLPPGLQADGQRTFKAAHDGLVRFGFESAQKVFDEGLRIYAPHVPPAAQACEVLGLEPDSIVAIRDSERIKQLGATINREALGWSAAIGEYVIAHAGEIAGFDGEKV